MDAGQVTLTLGGKMLSDCNHNGVPDEWELACGKDLGFSACARAGCVLWGPDGDGPFVDPLGSGVTVPAACDRDRDTVPDVCVADCDRNGARDVDEILAGTKSDCDGNGVPDECDPDEDCNGNGVQDICDVAAHASPDLNDNDVPDECECSAVSETTRVPGDFATLQDAVTCKY